MGSKRLWKPQDLVNEDHAVIHTFIVLQGRPDFNRFAFFSLVNGVLHQ
jgi:hypothetical protein